MGDSENTYNSCLSQGKNSVFRKKCKQKAAYKKQPQDVSLNELLQVAPLSFILVSN